MAEVVWTRPALHDLQRIHDFVAQDSSFYAEQLITRLLDRVQVLAKYPTMGRITPEVSNPVIRELREGKYRIVYRHQNELIEVLLVYHSARQQLPLRRLL